MTINSKLELRMVILSGLAAIILAWIIIIVSIVMNPWFRVTGNALSDLGGGDPMMNGHPVPVDPWIYNYGLMATGVVIAFFSCTAIKFLNRKIELMGLSFFVISGLFLALIGIYHEGTYPHDFVSIWFFIIASISYLTIGISIIWSSVRVFGISLLVLILASWVIYAFVPWQSVAEDEIFGVAVIDLAVILHIFSIVRRSGEIG